MGELDALRGLAIALVLLRHSFPSTFGGGGIIGVEVFFVLSGYLITRILRRQGADGIDLRRFYRNRVVRLVPGLAVVVVVNAAVAQGEVPTRTLVGGVLVALFFLGDVANLLSLPQVPRLEHLWTLAVEEQFYLVWPVTLMLAAPRLSDRVLSLGLVVAGTGALAATLVLFTVPDPVYILPTTWGLTILLGAVLALGAVRIPSGAGAATGALLLVLGLSVVPEAKAMVSTYLVILPLIAVATMVLITNGAGPAPLRILRWRPLQSLGLVSYSAYLWNLPLAGWFPGAWALPLTLVVAAASYHLVEQPFARFRRA